MINMGDYLAGKTIRIPFNTYGANGESVTVTDLAVGDVRIYKDGGITQRASTSGITLSLNHDGNTGSHLVNIDSSDNDDPGFYAIGSDYEVSFVGITVATQTLNPFAGIFSIQNRFMRGTDSAALASGLATHDNKIGTPANIDSGGATISDNLKKLADDNNGASFDATTDSLKAVRDRGDVAWITDGGGAGITNIINIQPLIPLTIGLADILTYRLGIMLFNSLDDLPSTAEITPGTISIDRKAIGATTWTSIFSDEVCLEIAGLVYFDEVFDSGTGYVQGDTIRITFKNQKVTVAANDYEIIGNTGRIFYTHIMQDAQINNMSNIITGITSGALDVNVITGNIDDIVSGQSLQIYRGDDQEITVTITDGDGNVVDLTNAELVFSVKENIEDTGFIFQRKNTAAGGSDAQFEIVAPATSGVATLKLVSANTLLEEIGEYQFDIELTDSNDKVSTISRGTFEILGDVTTPAVPAV